MAIQPIKMVTALTEIAGIKPFATIALILITLVSIAMDVLLTKLVMAIIASSG